MAGSGSPALDVDGSGLRVAIVAARWHEEFMDGLIEGAQLALSEAGVADPTLVRVPGSFELPIVAQGLARDHDAIVALGIIVRGGTPHFHYVSSAVTEGLVRVSLDESTPIGFGVLTCDNEGQVAQRVGRRGATESKGYEAAVAAVSTAALLRDRARGR